MNLTEKQRVLDVLNDLEVIESNGGEEAYILVANNKENESLLNSVGISKDTFEKYGDDETFCILSLAFCEGYCDLFIDGKLIAFDESLEIEVYSGKSIILYKHNSRFNLVITDDSGSVLKTELTNKQVEEIKSFIA